MMPHSLILAKYRSGMGLAPARSGKVALMPSRKHIHVIDPDVRRRAQIAFELTSRNLHAEIYESLEEFGAKIPLNGMILLADDPRACAPAELNAVLAEAGRRLPLAIYSNEPLPQGIVAAMLGGAVDYLGWPFAKPLLETALDRLAAAGERLAREGRREAAARAAVEALSDRELEVLELMMLGNSNKEIGCALGISPRTVEIHRSNMMRKLNARSTSEAVRVAMRAGLDCWPEDERIAA